jgi:hypothetical protein
LKSRILTSTIHQSLPEAEQLQRVGRDLENPPEERHAVSLQVASAQGASDIIARHVTRRVLNPRLFS